MSKNKNEVTVDLKNKRLMLYGILVCVILIAVVVGIYIFRKKYDIHTFQFSKAQVEIESVEYGTEGVINVTGAYISSKEETIITIEAVGKGETELLVNYRLIFDNENVLPLQYNGLIKVNSLGGIVEKSDLITNFNKYEYILYALFAILFISIVFMFWEFIDRARHGRFGYTMVACGGVSIFSGLLLMFLVYKYLNNGVRSIIDVIILSNQVGYLLLVLLIPVMFVMSAFLALSNIWLIRHEGRRPANMLGIAFGILWFTATVVALRPEILKLSYESEKVVTIFAVYASCYFECLFISTVICSIMAVYHKPKPDKDYIIILGCCIRKDGSLTPLLKARVDSALAFEKKQYEKTGRHAVFVPSGGQGPDEVISEAEAMQNYLVSCGVPKERILTDRKSVNTFQNMAFSKEVIEEAAGDITAKNVAFATTNYHVFRGYILSDKCGFHAEGISAKTKKYFFPNAFLREFVGLLYDKIINNLVYLMVFILFFLLIQMYIMG